LKRLPFLLILLISCSVFGQESDRTEAFLSGFLSVDQSSSSPKYFTDFLTTLEKKHAALKNERDFIEYAFTKTHQRFLKRYEAYAPISALFNKQGSYNCLTGTILYSLILDHFQIPHQVIETNYHIFILAETKQGEVLLEATDPLNGFVASSEDIKKRIKTYKENSLQTSNSTLSYYQFNFELFNTVSLKELSGLLYYNKAVDSYNHKNLQESVQLLKKAHELYSSSRIDEFSQILLLSLRQSKLEIQQRTACIKTVLSIRQDLVPVIASLN
jgi:hypothetical protein